ncbi:hypothetical protein THARTR1_10632 [Trichoderma harzianum]|uniref:Uncharacterized protein n=1 Tax=Trichoderma harzianum TaxID=5544 RepID=A0A2K0TNL8_TRIHA|nr:hypothetical protein THARTR1_10632 [Trichoderma harzianum]
MAPASLMTMPDEILVKICEYMCYHCSAHAYKVGDLALFSLTCRHLRDIAQPILYHHATPGNMVPFVRTLIERPDVAAQVRILFTDEAHRDSKLDTDIEIFQAEAQRLNHGNRNKWTREMLDDVIEYHHRLFELAIALLPNVKQITLLVPSKPQQELDELFGAPVALKSVRSLTVLPLELVDFGRFKCILAMMPRLERLQIEECHCITQALPLAELRTLIITESGISTGSLRNIIQSCPKLEHFEYHDWARDYPEYLDFEEECTWGLAQCILQSRKKTLKHLNFIFRVNCRMDDDLKPEDYLDSFRDFDGLETLWVLPISFGTADTQSGAPIFLRDVQDLVDMLPQSLTCLGLSCMHEDWQGIKILALAIEQGYFPKLKQVMVEQIDSDYDESCRILAPLNVSCFNLLLKCRSIEYYFRCSLGRKYPWPAHGHPIVI